MNEAQGNHSPRTTGGRPSSFSGTPTLLCFPLGVLAALALAWAISFEDFAYPWLLRTWPELKLLYRVWPLPPIFVAWQWICGSAAVVLLIASLVGLMFRRRWSLATLRVAYGVAYLLIATYALLALTVTAQVSAAVMEQPKPPAAGFVMELFYWRFHWLWPAAGLAGLTAALHVLSWRRATVNLYCRRVEHAPLIGDQVVENLRTHGRDPEFRKSVYGSWLTHLMVIVIIPMLLMLRGGCIRPYRVPLGSGQPAVAMIKVVQPKKKKKLRKYILSKDSGIVFEVPDLDDSELVKDVNDSTQLTYVADTSAAHGNMGTGGGKQAGWADGFGDGEIRFIRVQYDGPEWDDGMDESADANFLAAFQKLSGLDNNQVASEGESHPISHLRKYPKGEAPPFVYMTGSGNVRLSSSEMETMRAYIKEGGMIFGDAGSGRWDSEFRGMANALLPGSTLRPISDDDPIFQIPFTFPNGPPPLWFHGGKQTMGVKYKGRWAVFYFPGDMNDAWKTGHSGINPVLAEAAVHLGVNVVYYATTRYLEETRRYRK